MKLTLFWFILSGFFITEFHSKLYSTVAQYIPLNLVNHLQIKNQFGLTSFA